MEACPRLEMFALPQTVSAQESSSLGLIINKLIRLQFNENPDDFKHEVAKFTSLRNSACLRINVSESSLKNLRQYYCQLHFLRNRFKVLDSPLMKKGPFDFRWNDDDEDPLVTNYDSLDHEMGFVLYNIGVMHNLLGIQEDRSHSESMKKACGHFQSAAWAFHTLPDRHTLGTVTNIHQDYLTILSQITLAQAQECILEKSILDHKKPVIIVKVAAQVVEFYKQASVKVEASKGNMIKTWSNDIVKIMSKYCLYKKLYYNAVAHFFMGTVHEEEAKWGLALAYFERANKYLKESCEPVKQCHWNNAKTALNFANDVIEGKYNIAKRENEFIYHDRVPEDLPELKGQTLVKGIGFEINEENGGKDIFAKLIPLEAHTASSLYSEEKAKILRDLGDKIQVKDDALDSFLLSMNLEQVPNSGDYIALPSELIECAAGLSSSGMSSDNDQPMKKLSLAMAKLAEISADVQVNLEQVQEAVENYNQDEKEFKALVGKSMPTLDPALADELKRYQEAHKVASESNSTLHKAIQVHMENLKILSKPLAELQKSIPSMIDLDAEAEASIAEFQRIIKKVEEMKQQRSSLMDKIRSELLSDDITKKLVLHKTKEMPDIFNAEMKKHENNIKYLEQNLNAQENIIRAITEINAKYVPTRRKVAELIEARQDKISSLVDSFNAYENLTLKASKAIEFYGKLNTNVQDLQKKMQKSIDEKDKEKESVIAKLTKTSNTCPPNAASSRPTLKDYLNAAGRQQPANYPGYNTPMTSTGYPMYPPMAQGQAFHHQPPPPPQGYQYPNQAFPGYPQQSQQNYQHPGYVHPQQPQPNYGQQPQQAPSSGQPSINPNDLSLI